MNRINEGIPFRQKKKKKKKIRLILIIAIYKLLVIGSPHNCFFVDDVWPEPSTCTKLSLQNIGRRIKASMPLSCCDTEG